MEFRILGSIEVVGDDGPLPLGAPKQRALLAFLLLNANTVVSRDRLVDTLWGAEPPRSAVSSLQVYVHGLRRALGGERIERHGTGYRLHLDPSALDLSRFERLVDQAVAALNSGRAADAAEDLAPRARSLARAAAGGSRRRARPRGGGGTARGAAAAGASSSSTTPSSRSAAHDELVPELERLIAAEPYREHVRAQYALALYRSGRQADALAACRAARELLVEELGVDPGPELQELERRILRHDPALAAPDAPAPVRVQLPTPPTPLVGRRLEVAGITRSSGATTYVSSRSPARAARARRGSRSPPPRSSGRSCATAPSSSTSPRCTIRRCSDPRSHRRSRVSETGEAMEDVLAASLRDRSMLLLLDNLEQLVPDVGLVARLLAAAPRLLVLATSRTPLRLAAEHEYAVPPLAPPEPGAGLSFEELAANDAVRLFAARAGAVDPEFKLDDSNAGAVAEVCARLDGLPLAIELAAARSKLLPPATISQRLDRALDLLVGGAQDLPEPPADAARDARVEPRPAERGRGHALRPARRLHGRLDARGGRGGLRREALDVLETLASLVDESLVRPLRRPTGEPRFAMLETIREYAAELLEASGEARDRAPAPLRAHPGAGRGGRGGVARRRRSAASPSSASSTRSTTTFARPCLGSDAGEIELEVRLAFAARWYWVVQGHLSEGRRFFDGHLEHTADEPKELRARALVHGAIFPFRQGDTRLARLWSRRASTSTESSATRKRSPARSPSSAASRSPRKISTRAAALLRGGGSALPRAGPAESPRRIAGESRHGRPHAAGSRPPSVLRRGDRASRRRATTDGTAVNLHNLARSELALGRPAEGLDALRESLTIARRIGYREVIAYCLGGLAELAMIEAEPERAATMLGASDHLFVEIGAIPSPDEAQVQERVAAYVVDALGEERAVKRRGEGAATDLDELLDEVASGP